MDNTILLLEVLVPILYLKCVISHVLLYTVGYRVTNKKTTLNVAKKHIQILDAILISDLDYLD